MAQFSLELVLQWQKEHLPFFGNPSSQPLLGASYARRSVATDTSAGSGFRKPMGTFQAVIRPKVHVRDFNEEFYHDSRVNFMCSDDITSRLLNPTLTTLAKHLL